MDNLCNKNLHSAIFISFIRLLIELLDGGNLAI